MFTCLYLLIISLNSNSSFCSQSEHYDKSGQAPDVLGGAMDTKILSHRSLESNSVASQRKRITKSFVVRRPRRERFARTLGKVISSDVMSEADYWRRKYDDDVRSCELRGKCR